MSSISANPFMSTLISNHLLEEVATSGKAEFFQTFTVTQPVSILASCPNSLPQTPPAHLTDLETENSASRSGSLSPIRSSSVFSEQATPEQVVKATSKAGRKRKSEVIDRDARAKERVIRNRAAAQESRDRKRRYISELEESNNALKEQNDGLSMRLKIVEEEKLSLAKKLEALTAQLAHFQSQMHANPISQQPVMSNFLVGSFGESAVLTKSMSKIVSRQFYVDSQQRRLPTFKRNLYGPSSLSMDLPVCLNSYNISLVWWILIWIFSFGLNPNLLSLLPKTEGFRKKTDEDIAIQPLAYLSKVQESVKILRQDWVFAPSLRNNMLWPP